jgi:ABC-type nitrate/sulfonate/bicarbonate transport system substrate-binding protein
MTSDEFANKNPAAVQGIVNSYERALRLIRANPEIAKAVGRKYFPEVTESVINTALTRLTAEKVFPEHAVVSLESWRSAVQLRVGLGELKTADHDSLVDNKFANAALQLK